MRPLLILIVLSNPHDLLRDNIHQSNIYKNVEEERTVIEIATVTTSRQGDCEDPGSPTEVGRQGREVSLFASSTVYTRGEQVQKKRNVEVPSEKVRKKS